MAKRFCVHACRPEPDKRLRIGMPEMSKLHLNEMQPEVISCLLKFSTLAELNAAHKALQCVDHKLMAEQAMFSTKTWSGTHELAFAMSPRTRSPSMHSFVRYLNNVPMSSLHMIKRHYDQVTHLHLVCDGSFDPALLPSKLCVLQITDSQLMESIVPTMFPSSLTSLSMHMSSHSKKRARTIVGTPRLLLSMLPATLQCLTVVFVQLVCDVFPEALQRFDCKAHDIEDTLAIAQLPKTLTTLRLVGGYATICTVPPTEWLQFTKVTTFHVSLLYWTDLGPRPDLAIYHVGYQNIPPQVTHLTVEHTHMRESMKNLPRGLIELHLVRHRANDWQRQLLGNIHVPMSAGDLPLGLRKLTLLRSYGHELSFGVLPPQLMHLTANVDCLRTRNHNFPVVLPSSLHTLHLLAGQRNTMYIDHPCLLTHIKKLTLATMRRLQFEVQTVPVHRCQNPGVGLLRLPSDLTHLTFNNHPSSRKHISCDRMPVTLTHLDCQHAKITFGREPLHQRLKALHVKISGNSFSKLVREIRALPLTDKLYLTIASWDGGYFPTDEDAWSVLIQALDRSITTLEIVTNYNYIKLPAAVCWPPALQHLYVRHAQPLSSGCGFPESLTYLRLNVPLPSSIRPRHLHDFQMHADHVDYDSDGYGDRDSDAYDSESDESVSDSEEIQTD